MGQEVSTMEAIKEFRGVRWEGKDGSGGYPGPVCPDGGRSKGGTLNPEAQ